jgi:hypothetical protein
MTFNIQCTTTTGQIDRVRSTTLPAVGPQTIVPNSSGVGLPRCQAVYDSIEIRIRVVTEEQWSALTAYLGKSVAVLDAEEPEASDAGRCCAI